MIFQSLVSPRMGRTTRRRSESAGASLGRRTSPRSQLLTSPDRGGLPPIPPRSLTPPPHRAVAALSLAYDQPHGTLASQSFSSNANEFGEWFDARSQQSLDERIECPRRPDLSSSPSLQTCLVFETPEKKHGQFVSDSKIDSGKAKRTVMDWLYDDAPLDVLPSVLSFAGSRTVAALSKVSKAWRTLALSEPVWQKLCEDTGKWSPEANYKQAPASWLAYYEANPLVPVDYDTLEAAFAVGCRRSASTEHLVDQNNVRPRAREQHRSIRILLRPAKYVLRESLILHGVGDVQVTIETVETSHSKSFSGPVKMAENLWPEDETITSEQNLSPHGTPRSSRRLLRSMVGCRSASEVLVETRMANYHGDALLRHSASETASFDLETRKRAVIVLKTRKHNEPIFRVRQGVLNLNRIDLVHYSLGTDIWNGNAAVQVQPPFGENDTPLRAVAPSVIPRANLTGLDIASFSGRGVVVIDGGLANVNKCHIHNCAATGIYVGGPGSVATVEETDVVRNGNGNERSRRGIQRGHSGVYLEQGVATLQNCNISNNALTGISAISTENATLTTERSDLVGNGSIQLELPPLGSSSRGRCVVRDNVVNPRPGLSGRSRSGLGDAVDGRSIADASPRTNRSNGIDAHRHFLENNRDAGGANRLAG